MYGRPWKADYDLAAKLGEESEAAPYRIRLPPGFRPMPIPDLQGVVTEDTRVILWKGAPRDPDRGAAVPILMNSPLITRDAAAFLQSGISSLFEGLGGRLEDVVTGAPEQGTIDGIPFRRIHWTAKVPKRKGRVGGVVYLGLDQYESVQWIALDSEQDLAESLPLLEASILSRRRP